MPSHDTKHCYHLRLFQDHIDSRAIKVGDRKHKSNKSIDKTNSELQIYTDPFPSHTSNFIYASDSDPVSNDGSYVNMVTITSILPPS